MPRSVRHGATLLVLLLTACATAAPRPTEEPADGREVPDPPAAVHPEVAPPDVPSVYAVPWLRPRPRLRIDVRPPEAAVQLRSRRSASGIERTRRRLQGAWSFVYGESLGMAIFDRSGRLVLQAVGGEKVVLRYAVERAPGSDPGRVLLRVAPDSAAPGPSTRSGPVERPRRFRALFKWRSSRALDLQVPRAGEDWPEEFGRDRYRLFRDVEEALRYLRSNASEEPGRAVEHEAD